MCGIVGILNLDGALVSAEVLQEMTDSLVHRGPDGEGCFIDGAVGLGHRRLAIIDLSPAGAQPMATADGRYVISYNGEVYNFQELRLELEARGHQFHSRTDSEVVLNAFAEWGESALDHFNGMFAFAVWDKKRRELFLARDRYGIKPLYYAWRNNVFLFASEIKALLAHPLCNPEMDKEGLLEYFTFQNFLTDRTLFKGIHLFPTGSFAKVGAEAKASLELVRYWDFDFREPDVEADEGEYLEELRRLFRQAVERQLVSDVPVGSYLSGGMDSGSITAIAADKRADIRSFTIGFDMNSASVEERDIDERERARYMSGLLGTDHHEQVLKAGDIEKALPVLIRNIEEPRVGQSYPNFYAARLAGAHNKVVLSGTGGDELFGGYPWRYYRAVINDDFEHYIDKYYAYWQRLIPNAVIPEVFRPIWPDVKTVWTRDIFRDVFTSHATELATPEDYINHSLYFEAKTFLHGLLVVDDKLSMGNGLETRVPFLDNDLVDFAMRVPVHMKLGNLGEVMRLNENEPGAKTQKYYDQTRDGKVILRKAMRGFVSDEIADGIKQGFCGPDASWFRGESMDLIRRTLLEGEAAIYDYLDRDVVRPMVREHLEGKRNRRLLIWSLLSVEQWCREFLLDETVH